MRHEGKLMVPGPAGEIEAHYHAPDDANGTIVLCHPHPQYGGNMHDAVIDTIAGAAQRECIAQLRFNFRGVGASSGSFDHGVGEVDDLLAVLEWLGNETAVSSLLLAGYSFGSNIIWRALDRAGNVTQLLLIAPPVALMEYTPRPTLTTPTTIVCGDADEFVNPVDLLRWRDSSAPAAGIETIAGADHFFRGEYAALAATIERTLTR